MVFIYVYQKMIRHCILLKIMKVLTVCFQYNHLVKVVCLR